MSFKIRYIVLVLLCCFIFKIAKAQSFHYLNIETGLSNNFVRTIFKDSQGLMWFGTDTGLDSYDGSQIVNYAKRFHSPLKGAVQSIIEPKKGLFVIGTSWGAFQYHIEKNEIKPIKFDLPSPDVRKVFLSSQKMIYLATDKGLYTLDTNTLKAKSFTLNSKVPVSLTSIEEDNNAHIWVGGNDGIYEIAPDKKMIYHLSLHPGAQNILSIKLINSNIYIGTIRGLYVCHLKSRKISLVKGTQNLSVLSLAADDNNQLFIGTDNTGIYKLDLIAEDLLATKLNVFEKENELAGSFYAMYCDKSGILWAGTFDKGIYYKNLQSVKRFNTIAFPESAHANIRSFYLDKNGDKYIGTRNGKLICIDKNYRIKKTIDAANGKNFRSTVLTTIFPYPGKSDILLVGTFGGGITLFNKKTYTCSVISSSDFFSKGSVYKFCTDKNNQLWIATLDGLIQMNPENQSFQKFDISAFTGSNEIFTISTDKKDKIWIGTKTGICYYSLSEKRFYQPESCKPYKFQCTSSLVDSKGNAWFCFNKGGVLQIDKHLNEKLWLTGEIGLPENAPSSLIEDKNGDIWIGSSKGLFKVNKNNSVQSYGFEDGLSGIGFCPESGTMDASGDIWWSNDKGLVTFRGENNKNNEDIWIDENKSAFSFIISTLHRSWWLSLLFLILTGGIVFIWIRSYYKNKKFTSQIDELKKKPTQATATLKINEQKGAEIKDKLLTYMVDEKPYLNPDLRQADVAAATGFSVHEISQVLNVQLNHNFSDFVNAYRVEEIKLRMMTEDAKKYTLTAIAMQCGFSAKSSYLRAFKKATNMTPSEYMASLRA